MEIGQMNSIKEVQTYAQAQEELSQGRFVRCTVCQNNMRPFLLEGVNQVLLGPMQYGDDTTRTGVQLLEKHNNHSANKWRNASTGDGRTAVRRRDIVLCRTNDSDEIRLMRVVHVWGTLLLLRGDASIGPYESATVSDIIGVVLSITHKSGKTSNTTSRKWRYSSKAWTVSYKMRKYYKKIRHGLFM